MSIKYRKDKEHVESILKNFGSQREYGPQTNMRPLTRWMRAEHYDLNPPRDVLDALICNPKYNVPFVFTK